MQFEKIQYAGWDAFRLSNNIVDLVIPADIGIRIIRFGFVGGANEFAEFSLGKKGGDDWQLYGGHRLWYAPEQPRIYGPDNFPVQVEQIADNRVRVRQPIEKNTGIGKEIEIALSPDTTHVQLTHRLTNHNVWGVEFAPWALSVMAQNGLAIVPLPPRGTHPEDLLPANTLILWKYTDLTDPRWWFTKKYIMLRQDPNSTSPQKIGALNTENWLAYANHGNLFVKGFTNIPNAVYPDMGSNIETFTNEGMLELETLAPTVSVEPGMTVEHIETWHLFRDIPSPTTEADIDALVERYIKPTLAK